MSTDKKKYGEHYSIGEELLLDVPDIEVKFNAAYQAVNEGYFTLQEALKNYGVNEEQYLGYILLKSNAKGSLEERFFRILNIAIATYGSSKGKFKRSGQKAINEIQQIAESHH